MVRLMQDGISGSKIVAEVDGPAEIVAEISLLTVKNSHVLLGKEQVEFVIRPAGKGKVKVKITATFLENKPTVTNYEIRRQVNVNPSKSFGLTPKVTHAHRDWPPTTLSLGVFFSSRPAVCMLRCNTPAATQHLCPYSRRSNAHVP